MTIKNLGSRVKTVWEGLRPMTKEMLVGAMQKSAEKPGSTSRKFSYDTHADWELSRLLSALDEQSFSEKIRKNPAKLNEIKQLAETCAVVLEAKTGSAEVFIQLATRALSRINYDLLDRLGDVLVSRFSVSEIAEIIRQTKIPHICAISYEALSMRSVTSLLPLLEDPIYAEIGRASIEQQAYDFDNEDAQKILEEIEFDEFEFE